MELSGWEYGDGAISCSVLVECFKPAVKIFLGNYCSHLAGKQSSRYSIMKL